MRILWISHGPEMPTGYGNVTRFVCSGLADRGHEIDIFGWQVLEYDEYKSCRVHPGYSRNAEIEICNLIRNRRPEIVISLGNIWWLPYLLTASVRRQMLASDIPCALYFPVDGNTRDGQLPLDWVRILKTADFPIAMSRYGQKVAKRCGIDSDYIPHGVDLSVFSPPRDREAAKQRLGYSGKFVILSDSRNQPRKLLPRLLDVFARFAKSRADTLLHLHTDPKDEFLQGGVYSYDLLADIKYCGIESQVRLTSGFSPTYGNGLALSDLAAYYQAADIHLLASSGEGFGLPTLQAAASGAVPMACAYSASEELAGEAGEALDVHDWGETEIGILRAFLDVDKTVEKLAAYYENRAELAARSIKARTFAKSYSWDTVLDEWSRWLNSVVDGRRRRQSASQRSESGDSTTAAMLPAVSEGPTFAKSFKRDYERSEVRIPTTPRECRVGRVCVPKRMCYVVLSAGDIPIFDQLRQIFPALKGWVLASDGQNSPLPDGLGFCAAERPEHARYRLAQSALVLNTSCCVPELTLIDAALYGVPCVGRPQCKIQITLWPELATSDNARALAVGRELLTNAARYRCVVDQALLVCREVYRPSEEDAAKWLTQLHAMLPLQAEQMAAGIS